MFGATYAGDCITARELPLEELAAGGACEEDPDVEADPEGGAVGLGVREGSRGTGVDGPAELCGGGADAGGLAASDDSGYWLLPGMNRSSSNIMV